MPMPAELPSVPPLTDRFGRRITYLRLSVTDRCNLRCRYCLGPDARFVPRAHLLTTAEIAQLARAFVACGVTKIRLTGGEPLLRTDIVALVHALAALPGLAETVVTTNGVRLVPLADALRKAGVRRLNISLDSLRPERFRHLTGRGDLAAVLRGIDAARAAGFERIKLNTVILGGQNDDEIPDLVAFAVANGLNLSFIEEMPIGRVDRKARTTYYPNERIREELTHHYPLIATTETTGGPARYFRIPGTETRVGFVSPHSHNFCGDWNRVRVTADGQFVPCLGRAGTLDLRRILRETPGDTDRLHDAIRAAVDHKPAAHDLDWLHPLVRPMSQTGG